jgi:predicted RNase H-like HicB family nuclease
MDADYDEHPDGSRTYRVRDIDTGEIHQVHRKRGEHLFPVPFRALHHPNSIPPRQPGGGVSRMPTTWTIEYDVEADGRVIAEIAEVPGAIAYGADRAEARKNAIAVALESLAGDVPDGFDGVRIVDGGGT